MMSLFETCQLNGEIRRGNLVFSALDPARVVWALALPGSLCVIILTVPLSTQDNKWISTNKMLEGNPAIDLQPLRGSIVAQNLKPVQRSLELLE